MLNAIQCTASIKKKHNSNFLSLICPKGMTVLSQSCQSLCSQRETYAEGKCTLGLQPPLWNNQLSAFKGKLEFDVSCVASTLQTSDYFLSVCQKPPGTAEGCKWSVENVRDNVIENQWSEVVDFVSEGGMASQHCVTTRVWNQTPQKLNTPSLQVWGGSQ